MLSVKRLTYSVLLVLFLVGAFVFYGVVEKQTSNVQAADSSANEKAFLGQINIDSGDKPRIWVFGKSASEKASTDSGSADSAAILSTVLQYCKDVQLATAINASGESFKPAANDIVVFCTENPEDYLSADALEQYLGAGGKAVFAAGVEGASRSSSLAGLLGIKSTNGKLDCSSLKFNKPLLPLQADKVKYAGKSSSLALNLEDSATVFLQDENLGTPLVYTYTYHDGNVCVINGNFLTNLAYSGIFSSALAQVSDEFIYPVVGTKSVFLDNFPMTGYLNNETSMRLYGYSAQGFILDVLAPAFQSVSLRTKTYYTVSVPAVSSTQESFPPNNEELLTSVGKAAVQFGDEVAYSANCSNTNKVVFNTNLIDQFQSTFPNYSIRALTLGSQDYSPSMLNVPGTNINYLRGFLTSSNNNLRFSSKPNLTVFPAATEGHTMEEGKLFEIYCALASYGMVSHVFDFESMVVGPNNEAAWDSARYQLGSFEEGVLDRVPWLEGRTLTQTAPEVKSYSEMKYSWKRVNDQLVLQCSKAVEGQAFFFHSAKEIAQCEGATFEKVGNGYYLLRVKENTATITLKEVK